MFPHLRTALSNHGEQSRKNEQAFFSSRIKPLWFYIYQYGLYSPVCAESLAYTYLDEHWRIKTVKAIFVLFSLLLLTACVTDQLNSGFERIRGQPLSAAIDRLGVPSNERTLAGRHVYTWTTSQLVSTYQPTSNFTTGSIPDGPGKTRYTGTSVGGTTVQTKATCKIEIEVDSQEVIRHGSYDGDVGACGKYAQALSR